MQSLRDPGWSWLCHLHHGASKVILDVYHPSQQKEGAWWNTCVQFLWGVWKWQHHFCLYLIRKNSVLWPRLTERQTGKHCTTGQKCAWYNYKDGTIKIWTLEWPAVSYNGWEAYQFPIGDTQHRDRQFLLPIFISTFAGIIWMEVSPERAALL